MTHPYAEYEPTRLWRALDAEIASLEQNGDLTLTTARPYVIGALCRGVVLSAAMSPLPPKPVDGQRLESQCAFCGEMIRDASPLTFVLPLEDGGEQFLPYHRACLIRSVHPSVPLGI